MCNCDCGATVFSCENYSHRTMVHVRTGAAFVSVEWRGRGDTHCPLLLQHAHMQPSAAHGHRSAHGCCGSSVFFVLVGPWQ